MGDAYIVELVAGFLYLLTGARLLSHASRTGQLPERILSYVLLLMGVSYVFYELPHAFEVLAQESICVVVGRVLFDLSVIALAIFTKRVFHEGHSWASLAIASVVALIVLGDAASMLQGDWLGYAPLETWGFWLEWVGQVLPAAWLAIEAAVAYARARRLRVLGMMDPLAMHRYLLLGWFGLAQVLSSFVLIPMYIEFETGSPFSIQMDALLGALEIACSALVWFAFLPPNFYRDRLGRVARDRAGSV
ncbi:MAG: hypothetical protein OEM49_15825 [Myxococcales bacterium]|nr:hypothetical protein [Myxococcales bacterium]MDH5306843.1 hypothetical protein [Myxococcales bacterium]MDH5567339.1 hypothetical protein [Myxococcales bacterium]